MNRRGLGEDFDEASTVSSVESLRPSHKGVAQSRLRRSVALPRLRLFASRFMGSHHLLTDLHMAHEPLPWHASIEFMLAPEFMRNHSTVHKENENEEDAISVHRKKRVFEKVTTG